MMQTQTQSVETEQKTGVSYRVDDDGVAVIVFDDPNKKVNTFNEGILVRLKEIVAEIDGAARDGRVRGVLVTSGKPGTFIAGADINLIAELSSASDAESAAEGGQAIFNAIQDLPVPTMALIDGVCLGGGLELALSCDYRIATDNEKTKLGLPETQLGILPGWGGTFRLPRTVGIEAATKMILTGSTVDARKALKSGLVDLMYPAAFLDEWGRAALLQIIKEGHHDQIERNRRSALKRRKTLIEGNAIGRWLLFRTARNDIKKRTGGHYPAPLTALDVLRRGAGGSRNSLANPRARTRNLERERRAFGQLAVTPESTELVRIFFAREAVKRNPILDHAVADETIDRAAVLGAGVMGGRIAWLFSKHDIPVVMKDIAWEAVQKGYESAASVYATLIKKRKIDAREAELKMSRIHGTISDGAIGRPDIVVEAVVENIDVKKSVLKELENRVGADVIIASNTSALSIDEIAAELRHPERFVGMHFFNPVNRMPLVEVVRGRASSDRVVAAVYQLALRMGKTPIVVGDAPGFVVNRLLLPYLNEAAVMLDEGVSIEHVDGVYTRFGMPMGPYTLLDEVGIDVAHHVAETLYRSFGDRMQTAPILETLSERPHILGKKNGTGFYLYSGGSQRGVNPEIHTVIKERARTAAGGPAPEDNDILDRGMLSIVNEATRLLEEGVVADAKDIDLAMIMGTGFPPFRGGPLRWADTYGISAIVERLGVLAERYGDRFSPAAQLTEMASRGVGFYEAP